MAKKTGVYRIIGGQWRGRKLAIPNVEGVRPTPDRVRETLFNWLAQEIHGARCLDAFAGSGALGVEALSRGAARVEFIDRSAVVTKHLTQQLRTLTTEISQITQSDFLTALLTPHYDVIFLDPPFRKNLLPKVLAKAVSLLSPAGLIYLECERELDLAAIGSQYSLTLIKHKIAGQLQFGLLNPRNGS